MVSLFSGFVLEQPDLVFSFEGASDIDIFLLEVAKLVDRLFAIEQKDGLGGVFLIVIC